MHQANECKWLWNNYLISINSQEMVKHVSCSPKRSITHRITSENNVIEFHWNRLSIWWIFIRIFLNFILQALITKRTHYNKWCNEELWALSLTTDHFVRVTFTKLNQSIWLIDQSHKIELVAACNGLKNSSIFSKFQSFL